MKKSTKLGILIISAFVLVALAILGITALNNSHKTATSNMIVYVNGEKYTTTPLVNGQTVTVRQEDGSENVIRMTDNGFYMESSTCPHHECIDQGPVTLDNWQSRKLLEQVICLPNRVTVALELTERTGSELELPDF